MSETGSDVVTPELALVDPELAKAQRKIPDRKAAMSSSTPSNGTFFIDPAQPAPSVGPDLSEAPAPLAAPDPVPAPEPAAAPPVQPPRALLPVDDGSTPMRDVPLGTLIFRAGLLAEEQLEDALQEGMRSGKRLGEVLLERGWLHERDLGRLLAGQKGLPFVEIRASDAEPSALRLLPEEKARLQTALPLRYEDGQLVVAVADPSNELVLENLRRSLGSEPRLVVAPQAELIRAIGEAYTGAVTATAAEPEPDFQPEPALEPDTTLAPEPEPTLQPEPTLMEEPTPMTEPTVMPEPILAPQPTPLQPEQPAAPPVAAPLPTVLPPEEAREPEHAPALQPPVLEPAAEAPPQPSAIEPMTLSTPPVEEAPAAILQQPAPLAEPSAVPEAITPLAPPPVDAEPALTAPLAPPAALQPPMLVEPQPTPEAPPAALQPLENAPVPVEQVVAMPPPVAPAPVASPEAETPASIHIVLLRLRDGEALEVGTFASAAEASARAQEVVKQIAAAEGEASWPFFADRYLRPDTIVSVDLLEETSDKWLGSAARKSWANANA